ncbi:hypothetical protein A3Q56_05262, partial [Intoshia linei]
MNKLSDAILLNIFGNIAILERFTLCLVCRKWRNLITKSSKLYSKISFINLGHDLRTITQNEINRTGHRENLESSNRVENSDTVSPHVHRKFKLYNNSKRQQIVTKSQAINIITNYGFNHLLHLELPAEFIRVDIIRQVSLCCKNLKILVFECSNYAMTADFSNIGRIYSNLEKLIIFLPLDTIPISIFLKKIISNTKKFKVFSVLGSKNSKINHSIESVIDQIGIFQLCRKYFGNLIVLNFYSLLTINDEHILVICQYCQNLECLMLNHCVNVKGRFISKIFNQLQKLKSLHLEYCCIYNLYFGIYYIMAVFSNRCEYLKSLKSENFENSTDWNQNNLTELTIGASNLPQDVMNSIITKVLHLRLLSLSHYRYL